MAFSSWVSILKRVVPPFFYILEIKGFLFADYLKCGLPDLLPLYLPLSPNGLMYPHPIPISSVNNFNLLPSSLWTKASLSCREFQKPSSIDQVSLDQVRRAGGVFLYFFFFNLMLILVVEHLPTTWYSVPVSLDI